jgi:hypothetical protein
MKMRDLQVFGTVIAIALGGCTMSRMCSLRITNQTQQVVRVTSGNTGKTVVIKAGASGVIDHAIGALDIATADGRAWHYSEISVPDTPQSIDSTDLTGQSRSRLELVLDNGGVLRSTSKSGKTNSAAIFRPAAGITR